VIRDASAVVIRLHDLLDLPRVNAPRLRAQERGLGTAAFCELCPPTTHEESNDETASTPQTTKGTAAAFEFGFDSAQKNRLKYRKTAADLPWKGMVG
jgi:hypothetical protein